LDESTQIAVRFKPDAADIPAAEVALLESILPEIIRAMIQAEEISEAE
jgi:hypothetical protein